MRRLTVTLAALAALGLASPVMAQPRLVAASPAARATVAKPTQIKLSFSEALAGPLSGIELIMTGMPGMANHPPMPIRGFKTATAGKDLVVTLPRALPAGTYSLKWHAAGADKQRVTGAYTFTVR
ncbi:hypothetical protein B0I00_1854 [Novosphingobium kunmingense]|uniref:CopC domain-containing protein n=1 Tax=Novosphingobium kunmingense TaxID=1211806 RepID=A0A2N0HL01_9SPHN|nr:copper resistance protein CopC [Novosphingobium kunmingense]PKB19616.1 hypothetical protein B0I00_1854 [Novosphingobium kunmingense]